MKILFYTDVHWSQYSSIVRGRDGRYSTRIDNLIKSVNWAEHLADTLGCSRIVCGGDFFDSATINSEEASALKEVCWSKLLHTFIVGNHEVQLGNLDHSTLDIFNLCPNCEVLNSPTSEVVGDTQLCFVPYFTENDRLPLNDLLGDKK